METPVPPDSASPALSAARFAAGAPRPRPLHVPYLIVAALFALASSVFFHVPGGHRAHGVMLGLALISFPVHVVWLSGVFEDCQRVLRSVLPLDSGKVRWATVLTAPVYCLWAPFLLRLIFRSALVRALERGSSVAPQIQRCEEAALGLQRGGLLTLGVALAVTLRIAFALKPYSDSGTVPEVLDYGAILGPAILWSQTLFQLVIGAAYIWFAATAVPLLYRNLPRLEAAAIP